MKSLLTWSQMMLSKVCRSCEDLKRRQNSEHVHFKHISQLDGSGGCVVFHGSLAQYDPSGLMANTC